MIFGVFIDQDFCLILVDFLLPSGILISIAKVGSALNVMINNMLSLFTTPLYICKFINTEDFTNNVFTNRRLKFLKNMPVHLRRTYGVDLILEVLSAL
jgi:hypothetical protein